MKALQIGDNVAYSASFLRSIACYAGDMAHARGVITDIKPLGERQLVSIDWDRPDIPTKVISANLAIVGTPGMSAN